MKISIGTTLYYSEKYIEEFILRIKKTLNEYKFNNYEIILVNDGSPDNSLSVASELCQHDSSIKVINLSRNFGHYNAILTGLEHSDGDLVFLLDVDLEDQPEWLGLFYSELNKKKAMLFMERKIKEEMINFLEIFIINFQAICWI